MIRLTIDFHCPLCGQNKDFYAMPMDKAVGKNDTVPSLTDYLLRCKKCKKKFVLKYEIRML